MSKFVSVPNGDYKVTVRSGGTITLDTGLESGTVVVTGDLLVQGNTTTVESEDMAIRDNIIIVNKGETGPGISLERAGLQVDRGSLSDAFFVFNENISWRDPATETTKTGAFTFTNDSGGLIGIRTNSISTGGGDLYLINSGNGVISVTGTTNYELNVVDDDHITNKKYVDDAITTAFATVFLQQIGDGFINPSSIEVDDNESTGVDSVINFKIDSQLVSQLYADRWEFSDIRIIGTTIETITSDQDLTLRAPGVGVVRIDDTLELTRVPGDDDELTLVPNAPTDGIKLYINQQDAGKTGIYFVNDSNNRDELVSKNRALLFGMLF
jgi:hypothetical protein